VLSPIFPAFLTFDARTLLNKLEREFASEADLKGLEHRSRESRVSLLSYPALLELIVRNLLASAVRYTERGGVLVSCRTRGGQAVLAVHDTGIGIGIAKAEPPEVVKTFKQLANPERDRRKGLELGFAIVQKLAASLKHPLPLKSALGRGSVFELTIPIAQARDLASSAAALDASPLACAWVQRAFHKPWPLRLALAPMPWPVITAFVVTRTAWMPSKRCGPLEITDWPHF
jgi:two-component system, sensor histidine kinase